MPKLSTKPYAKSDSPFFKTEGLRLTKKSDTFEASPKGSDEKVTLTYTFNEVSFNGNLAVATAAFGNVQNLIKEAEESVNSWLVTQAKNNAKSEGLVFEQKVADAVNAAFAKFTEQRGSAPTDEQKGKIRAKVRVNLEELERKAKEVADLSDIE